MEQIKEKVENRLILFGAKKDRYGRFTMDTALDGIPIHIRLRLLKYTLILERHVHGYARTTFKQMAYEYYAPQLIPAQWEVLRIGCYVLGKTELTYNEKSIKW